MKPNDKAYQAGVKLCWDYPRATPFIVRKILNAAYAAQFQIEDYAGLIKKLRSERGCIASPDDCLAAADTIEAQAKEIIGLDSQLRDSHEMTCHQDARIAELEAENAKLRTLLLNLADAADGVGVKHFDTDSFSDEVEEMRLSTLAAREELKKPAQL